MKEDEYIVALRPDSVTSSVSDTAADLIRPYDGSCHVNKVFVNVLTGFSAHLSSFALVNMLEDERVLYIEEVSCRVCAVLNEVDYHYFDVHSY